MIVFFTSKKKSSIDTVLCPFDLLSFNSAPNASSGVDVSEHGDALTRLPPTVPMLRMSGEPIWLAASAKMGALCKTIGDLSRDRCLVNAPILRSPPFCLTKSSSLRRLISTTY
jgi:hypothetical protein